MTDHDERLTGPTSENAHTCTPDSAPQCNPYDGGTWLSFFTFAGGSILYCLSALSIIYGIAKILGPQLATTSVLSDAYPCLAALNLYEIALLGVLVFIVVWEKVTDDSISLVVLVALFLVGSGLSLSAVANSGARVALIIGGVCFAAGIGKLYVLRRCIGIAINRVSFGALVVILAWNFGTGGVMARIASCESVSRGQWLIGSLLLVASGVTIFLDSERFRGMREDTENDFGTTPFLRHAAMPLVFALILLVSALIHQYVLGYVFDVRSDVGDYLPLVCVISLVAVQLSLSVSARIGLFETGLASLPAAVSLFALLRKSVLVGPSLGVELLWYPPVFLGLTGASILWMAFRMRSPKLFAVAAAYALCVVLTFGFSPSDALGLNWHAFGGILVVGLLCVGLITRNIVACCAAVAVGTMGFATTDMFDQLAHLWKITPTGLVFGFAGMGGVLLAMLFGRDMPYVLSVLGSLGVMIFTFDAMCTEPAPLDILVGFYVLVIGGTLWLRTRQLSPLLILLIPVGCRLWIVFTKLTAWRYVILSFILLFVGGWMSVLKGRHSKRDTEESTPSDASVGEPTAAPPADH